MNNSVLTKINSKIDNENRMRELYTRNDNKIKYYRANSYERRRMNDCLF